MATISLKDKHILRELAKKQMAYATTPENQARKKAWYAHNDLKATRPLVTIEEWTFAHEVERPLSCETEKGREFERQLLNHITAREDIDDDRATPDYFAVNRRAWFRPFGIDPQTHHVGNTVAYEFIPIIHDLEEDIHKLGKSQWGYDFNESTLALAQDIFDGIIDVKTLTRGPGGGLSFIMTSYMTLETMMFSMADYPDLFEKTVKRLSEDLFEYHKELESAGYFITNNLNQPVAQGTCAATTHLEYKEGAKLSDMWGYFDSQETSGVSPGMFAEFFFPHYKRLIDMCGLVNYGCCEPVHSIWDNCLSQCKNIRKLSISPWCDEEFIGDRLRGTKTIYHRKPSPNLVGEKTFDEQAYAEGIKKTLKAAKGCKLEFSLRDIYSLGGEKARAGHVVRLIWDLIERHWEG